MITYDTGNLFGISSGGAVRKLFGSGFSVAAIVASIFAGVLAVAVKLIEQHANVDISDEHVPKGELYSAFSAFVSFAVLFRTGHGFARYVEGAKLIHQFTGTLFDACSSLISFCRSSKAERERVSRFEHTIVRVMSLLNALAFHELALEEIGVEEVREHHRHCKKHAWEMIDVMGLDHASLKTILKSDTPVETVFHMAQALIMEAIAEGVINTPPPLVSPTLEELGNGMAWLHAALHISHIPFPFPYVAITEVLLILHLVYTPFMVVIWTEHVHTAGLFAMIVVLPLWFLSGMATELDNPFGHDLNDLDMDGLQRGLNRQLLNLLSLSQAPTISLSSTAIMNTQRLHIPEQAGRIGFEYILGALAREDEEAKIDLTGQVPAEPPGVPGDIS